MIKRIISIIGVMIITIAIFIPIVNAESEYIVIPETDREPLYEILPSVDQGGGAEPYIVYGIDVSSVTVVDSPVGFISHFFGTNRVAGEYYVNMYSTRSTEVRSRLRLWIGTNETMALWYEVGNFLTGDSSTYYQYRITPAIPTDNDFMILSTNNGELIQYYYNIDTEQPNTSLATPILSFCFIGDIYLYGQTPGDIDNALIKDAFDRGKAEGLEEGYTDGYTEGFADGKPSQEVYDQYYEAGKSEGEEIGYNKGYSDGATSDNAAVYAKGIEKGQEDANLVGSAINGFFNGMKGFFEPFLSIGFGSMTLFNLLGVIVVVTVVILIVKITRG